MEKIRLSDLENIDLKNKVIAFPTDTVYGVGAMIDDINAIKKIYDLKNRDYSKPLAILTPSNKIDDYVLNVNSKSKEMMEKYWPGALTIIFNKSDKINNIVTSNLVTVGFRMPNSEIALTVLKKFGIMATTSINISGEKPLNSVKEIEEKFSDSIDYIVIDEEKKSEVSSTVVDARDEKNVKILRQGDIKVF